MLKWVFGVFDIRTSGFSGLTGMRRVRDCEGIGLSGGDLDFRVADVRVRFR